MCTVTLTTPLREQKIGSGSGSGGEGEGEGVDGSEGEGDEGDSDNSYRKYQLKKSKILVQTNKWDDNAKK